MPNHRPEAIANEFLRRRADQTWPQQMLVQKLTYIAHGWNLAINGEPLSYVAPEAWDNGPVFREIWDNIKSFGYRGPNCTLIDPATGAEYRSNFTANEIAVIDHVWNKHRFDTANKLSQMTHEPETPWWRAYFGRGRNAPLDTNDIHQHYYQLAIAGREHRA